MRYIVIALFFITSAACAQEKYHAGVFSFNLTVKIDMNISIADSTVTFESMEKKELWTVTNSTESAIYITDGTATDRLKVHPAAGKLKGFSYDHIINIEKDSRFNGGGQVSYFCKKFH
jgi:hypothetical protein